ncbi:MAG: small conductance mechanosensitive channel [Planctomycetota bacterium]
MTLPTLLDVDTSGLLVLAGTLGGVFAVYLGTRRVLRRAGRARRYSDQWILIATANVGVLAVILALPIEAGTKTQVMGLLGILLSGAIALSSTTFLGNAMAGVMLRSLRNFRAGDFIEVGDNFGRVSERGVLHTEIQTADRDLVTLPNLLLVTQAVKVIRGSGTVVSATVSLGYDVARKRVEQALLEAGKRAGLDEPFVQIMELGDFSITYRGAGLCSEVRGLINLRAELRRHMLDSLHEAGIQIVSPSFAIERHLKADAPPVLPPDALEPAAPAEALAPTYLIFDKAELAAALATREEQLENLTKRQQEVETELAKAEDAQRADLEQEREQVAARLEHIEERMTHLRERIEQSEDQ